MSAPERHPATAKAWEWLESGEGRERPEENRRAVREALEELDAIFLGLWPRPPEPLPEDYWEGAQ